MLHERRLPYEVAKDLERVYSAKLRLLDWLLRSPPAGLPDSQVLVHQFGQALGDWLWARIRAPKTRTLFGTAVIALANTARAIPARAAEVADAIAYDAAFDTRWDVAGNDLRLPRLHPDWLGAIKGVALPFYEWLGGSGFGIEAFGLAHGHLDRTAVMKAFRPQSHGVCGYCDGPLGEKGSEFEANDCDHFFPKSHWPHLAVHPANLFSACKGCNSTWKLAKAPMGDADADGLDGTYHPMLRPGRTAVVVSAEVSSASARQMKISISDPVVPGRAKTLVATLDLESRWENSVNEKLDGKVSVLVAKTIRDKGRGWQADEQSVRQVIDDDIAWRVAQTGREERALRNVAVLQCMKRDLVSEVVAQLAP
jgi:hypothetical protein